VWEESGRGGFFFNMDLFRDKKNEFKDGYIKPPKRRGVRTEEREGSGAGES